MAQPCCPKCSSTHFDRFHHPNLNAWLIYCPKCGAVAGAIPYSLKSTGKTNTSTGATGGKTTNDSWEART
jgi:ribosomal protein L37AE/L43A